MTDPGGSSLTLLQFKGFNFPTFDPVALENLETFEFRDDDVLISAFPKAGTHWLWEIARMLVAGNAELPVLEKDDFMIEFNPSKEYFNSMPSPRILNTHVLYRHLPGLHNRKCKIIYVTRDPRDVAVSFYNHHRKLTSYYHYDGTWDNYFELFINGNVDYGCCLDHMRDWEDVIAAHPELNILVTSYEDLQEGAAIRDITFQNP
ncbi:hypothetical protein C0Q70_07045 [Pomacea canaliculata]|uniref:Sulfotransferase domain-containing protein n=1 Tax=Pomacea canaliculata TaxID=400727 RepID=A0A2T7PDZ4_POMCA|nr:hypothetical protein C0Q70_07045 [Pomacea canaliculata]